MSDLSIVVLGKPVSQGSMKAMISKTTKKPIVVAQNAKELRAWRKAVALAAFQQVGPLLLDEPVVIRCDFYFARNAAHPLDVYMDEAPDKDKLTRAIYDGLTGVVLYDDKRVVGGQQWKWWTDDEPRCEIKIKAINREL